MGVLEDYKYVLNYGINIQPRSKDIKRKPKRCVLKYPTVITVVTDDETSVNYTDMFVIEDYRRNSFDVTLLPIVELGYDIIADEVYGLKNYL